MKTKNTLEVVDDYGNGHHDCSNCEHCKSITTGSFTEYRCELSDSLVQHISEEIKKYCDYRPCLGIVVDESNTKRYKNYITWKNKKGEFNTECNRASLEDDLALTIPTKDQTKVALSGGGANLKIRKLTPKECLRLMGFTDDDYEAIRSIGMTDSAIYHMAGDSIVVPVLIGIFSQMIYENNQHKQIIEDYIKKGVIENKDE